MWALRRASLPLRHRVIRIGNSQTSFADLELPISYVNDQIKIFDSPNSKGFYITKNVSLKHFELRRDLSSRAGARSIGEEDEDDDGFSELDIPDSAKEVQHKDESSSELEITNDVEVEPSQNELELSDTETDPSEKRFVRNRATSTLFQAIIDSPNLSVDAVVNKWVDKGNELSREEVSLAMNNFRRSRMFGKALQLSEWLEASNQFEFDARNYASHLDLIAKVHGLEKAEKYIERIPNSCREEIVYRTLLASCVQANNLKKAEEVFQKMRDLDFPVTTFACNQLLILCKRFEKKKLADVLLMMEKEGVKPSLFTYKLLLDTKGQCHDLTGMENILERMKAEDIEPDRHTNFILARHYACAGLKDKAEAVLKEMEGGNLNHNRQVCEVLFLPYALLGKADEVERVWKVCEPNPQIWECMAAIEAFGKVKKIKEAEAVFDRMLKTWKKPFEKQYNALLKVYADNKLVAKGRDLVKRMADSGCPIGVLTWHTLVKLYVEAGEVEKADSILLNVAKKNQTKPLRGSYMIIMDQYAKAGDIHNSEKILYRMRQAGYPIQWRQFEFLLKAYKNAEAPLYGIRERMQADNIFPNKFLLPLIQQVDAFRKTSASYLLD
ncbi:hypothetical protein UlMin_006302 [Ulmus minor]